MSGWRTVVWRGRLLSGWRTVVWREWRDGVAGRSRSWGAAAFVGLVVVAVGLPLAIGPGRGSPFLIDALPLLLVPAAVAVPWALDSFAGERERHTLEGTMATPLSPLALRTGKTVAIVLPCWAAGAAWHACARATVQCAYGGEPLHAGSLLVGLLSCALVTQVAVTCSLAARTVEEARQTLVLSCVVAACGIALTFRLLGLSSDRTPAHAPGLVWILLTLGNAGLVILQRRLGIRP